VTNYSDYFQKHWSFLQEADILWPGRDQTWNNPGFDETSFRVLIVRLSPYRDVDRSTPHLFLFQAVRRVLPDAFIDMAFFPPYHDRKRFREAGVPFVTGVQSHSSMDDFDVVLVSNAYTLELINLYTLLLESGVPLRAGQRGDSFPPLILGGSNAMASQAIIMENADSLVDAIFFGEGEAEVERLVECLYEYRHHPKTTRLAQAARRVCGLWTTGSWPAGQIRKATVATAGSAHMLTDYPVLNGQQAGVAQLQVDVGCPAFCSFCFESYDRKPYREVPHATLLEHTRRLKQTQGCDTLELYSFNFNSHSQILDLLFDLNRVFNRVSAKSQRVDLLDSTVGLLEAEVIADKRSFTIGIEGISERMRRWLHKSLSAGVINRVVRRLLRQKIRQIKLFYILTGFETEDDLSEFRNFTHSLKSLQRKTNPGIRITFSFGMLVRMPFTPLRYSPLMLERDKWRKIIGPVKSACETNGFEFRLAVDWDEYCTAQVMAIGGYWLARPLENLARQGHCYDVRLTAGYWSELSQWMVSHGQWNASFLGEKPADYPFALGFVQSNVTPDFLYRQYREGQRWVDSGYCLGSAESPGTCLGCGACPSQEHRTAIIQHTPRGAGDEDYLSRLRELMTVKHRIAPVYVRLRIPCTAQGASPEWLNALVLRSILGTYPALTDNILAATESLFTSGRNRRRYPSMTGETVFSLRAWNPDALTETMTSTPHVLKGGIEFCGLVGNFEPGVFRQAEISISLPAQAFPNVRKGLLHFLRSAYVPVNIRRTRDPDSFVLDLPAKALKKRVVLDGQLTESSEGTRIRLVITPKFQLLDFLKSISRSNALYRFTHTEVVGLELK